MRNAIIDSKILFLTFILILLPCSLFSNDFSFPPDTSFHEYRGVVKDKVTDDAIPFASVYLTGTNIGTVTNTEGQFTIKIPTRLQKNKITVSCLGYKNLEVSVSDLQKTQNEIRIEMLRYYIKELTVKNIDPYQIIKDALEKVPVNYSDLPSMLTVFYRESIKQNRNYVAVSEGIFGVYKAPYSHYIDSDRIKIYKGRKSQDVSKMDTVLFKLQGGPYYLFMLDIVKNPENLFSVETLNYYNLKYGGMETVEDREAYVIEFDQKEDVRLALYQGKIYIDAATFAISEVDFHLSPYGIYYAEDAMILKKPLGMRIDIPEANYFVKYRVIDKRWYLSYARMEARFRCKWNKKLFRSNYSTVSEMAITDIDNEKIIRYKFRETSKPTDVFSEQVDAFSDPEFWEDFNIIRPEESLIEATQRLSKKLNRK